jgi:hypothetical protein
MGAADEARGMSGWFIDAVWIAAVALGIVLSVMYFGAAKKLYTRDKEVVAARSDEPGANEPHAEPPLGNDAPGGSSAPKGS